MPRGYNNYNFVIDSSFRPFEMNELLTPMLMYKDVYEQSENAYNDLTSKADRFKYLSQTLPEGSQSRQIYEGYANELNQQAEDLARNGLSMSNRRALTNLKRRYQGEIGRLELADQALQEERKLRRQMSAKDPSMLYALDNLSIDSFLDGNTPNLYNISGNELYSRGAAAGRAASSRIYSAGDEGSTLGGYYRKWVERNGYSADSINAFRANAAAIPELQQAADAILQERGVLENLSGSNLERARQSVLNGIIDGAVYQASVKPVRDENVLGVSDRIHLAQQGYEWKNGELIYNADKDPAVKRAKAIAEIKNNQSTSTGTRVNRGNGGSNSRYTQLPKGVRLEWNDDPTVLGATYTSTDLDSSPSAETEHKGIAVTYDELPQYAKDRVDAILGPEGNVDLHSYWFRPYESGTFDDTEAILEIFPYKVSIFNGEDDSDMLGDKDLEGGN